MRAGKVFLVIGVLLFCALLVVFVMALEGEKNTVSPPPATTR